MVCRLGKELAFTTAGTVIVEGLRAVRARRVAVATVYTEEINLHLQGFLEESGFEVVTIKGFPFHYSSWQWESPKRGIRNKKSAPRTSSASLARNV